MRTHVFTIIKIVTAIKLVYTTFDRLSKIQKEFNEQALFLMNDGSLTVSLLLAVLLVKLKLSLVDYVHFSILAVRVSVIFLVMHLIDVSASGFELIKHKDLKGTFNFLASTTQIIGICNLRLNYLVTLPLTFVCLIMVQSYATATNNDDNLACSSSNPGG